MSGARTILTSATSDQGMGSLEPHQFEQALLSLVSDWMAGPAAVPVLACGMVGARQGWKEAEYLTVPTAPLVPNQFCAVKAQDSRLKVSIVPGLQQTDPPDVMRGEETQVAGFLAGAPEFQGVICMPGTHTKWVQVSDGKIARFQSFMTGEVCSLLERQSVLRHSLGSNALSRPVFEDAVRQVFADPTLAVSGLFGLRADDLLNNQDATTLRSKLSAFLIGAEVQAAVGALDCSTIVIIGAAELAGLYDRALALKGLAPRLVDAETLTLDGLCAARALLESGNT